MPKDETTQWGKTPGRTPARAAMRPLQRDCPSDSARKRLFRDRQHTEPTRRASQEPQSQQSANHDKLPPPGDTLSLRCQTASSSLRDTSRQANHRHRRAFHSTHGVQNPLFWLPGRWSQEWCGAQKRDSIRGLGAPNQSSSGDDGDCAVKVITPGGCQLLSSLVRPPPRGLNKARPQLGAAEALHFWGCRQSRALEVAFLGFAVLAAPELGFVQRFTSPREGGGW